MQKLDAKIAATVLETEFTKAIGHCYGQDRLSAAIHLSLKRQAVRHALQRLSANISPVEVKQITQRMAKLEVELNQMAYAK